MRGRALALERRLELLQDVALLARQLHRRLDDDVAEEIARAPRAHRLDALAAELEELARLRLGGNRNARLAVERRHRERRAERGLREADRHLAMQVVAVALEDRMLAHADFDVEIARRR